MSEYAGANWYPDPQNPGQQRWWDGTKWTDATQPDPAAGGGAGWQSAQPEAGGWQQPATQAGGNWMAGGYQQPDVPGAGGYQQPGAGYQQPVAGPGTAGYQQPGAPGYQVPGAAGTGGWASGPPASSVGWQQPGAGAYTTPMPANVPGQLPGGPRWVLWAIIGSFGIVFVAGLIAGVVYALGHGGNATPTAQSSNVGTGQPASPAQSPSATFDQAQECTKDVSPLAQQMVNISNELTHNPSNAVTLVNQEANLYNQAASNASGDPQLSTDLSNVATDLSNLGTDVTNQDATSAQADLTQLETDVTAVERLCGEG